MTTKTAIPAGLTRVESEVSLGSQDATLLELWEYQTPDGIEKLRVKIKSDSYPEQSYADVEVWSGKKWEPLWHIRGTAMVTPSKLYYALHGKPVLHTDVHFVADRTKLLNFAARVLA